MRTTTVSGRPSPSTSPDTRESASVVVIFVADPGAVHTPTFFSGIPPVLQRDPVAVCPVGPRGDAPALLRHDRTQHAYRERARRRIEDLATQQLPEDLRHRPSRREARAPGRPGI